MTTQITATVVNGLLKPDKQLLFADQTRVKLTVEPIGQPIEPMKAWASIKERLRVRPIHAAGLHFTRDELNDRR